MRKPYVLVFRKPGGLAAYHAVVNHDEVEQLYEKLGRGRKFFPISESEPGSAAELRHELRRHLSVDFELDPAKESRRAYTVVWEGEDWDESFMQGMSIRLSDGELFRMAEALLENSLIQDVLAVPLDERPLGPYELKDALRMEEGIDFQVMEGPREWSPRGLIM